MPKQVYAPEPLGTRYTPLPPIVSKDYDDDSDAKEVTNSQDSDYSGDELDSSEIIDIDVTNVSQEEIFKELTQILPLMAKRVRLKHAAYLGSVADKYRNPVEGDKLGKHLVSLEFVEIFQRHWKTNFEEIMKSNLKQWYVAYSLLLVMWNMSDKCTTVCERVLKVQHHSDLLDLMKSKHLHPYKMNEDKPSAVVQAFIGILHNVVQRASGARESLRSCDAVERLQPFRECGNAMISCVSLMIQSYLVTEAENEKINSSDDVFELLATLLKASISQRSYMGVNFAVIEVLEVLNKLAANDKNKYRIVKSGALPYYVELMKPKWTPRVQAEAAHGLWILAFKCKDDILKLPGCIEGLKALLENSDETVKKEAEGALWIIEEKNEPTTEHQKLADPAVNNEEHIFISYQWDSKPVVLKIRDRLKATGFRVWIDEDDMSGNVLDAMATAVEKAAIVVICLSQKYMESPNCRTEAEYTFRLKKKIIPVRLQPKYYPDGWLGLMVGSKLVLDFSDPGRAQENMKHLIKELGGIGRSEDEVDTIKQVAVPLTHALNYPTHEKTSPVQYWTKEDVDLWVKDNNLGRVADLFSFFTGSLLLEYNAMRHEAPEAFFAYLIKKDIQLVDALAVSQALKSL